MRLNPGSLLTGILLLWGIGANAGILYPRETPTRELKSLSGLWNFVVPSSPEEELRGYQEEWYRTGLRAVANVTVDLIPVPSSYNDIFTDAAIRDHVGIVWYDRIVFLPPNNERSRVWLRFGSVCYAAQVWVNGEPVATHEIGHLPFQAEITPYLLATGENLITVAVNNTLSPVTIPQGALQVLPSGRTIQTYTFDFFNYAGIDRPVVIYNTPVVYIDDVTVTTDVSDDGNAATVNYDVVADVGDETVTVTLLDGAGRAVATADGPTGALQVSQPNLWWPYLMSDSPGYLYTLRIQLMSGNNVIDVYNLPIGIRTLRWDDNSFLINNRPVYLKGFGRHEDSDIRGKGLDLAIVLRDYNLIKWIGANAYRTSHYPYAEEILDLADREGIMIILECPSVNTEIFSEELLVNHQRAVTEMVQRDKNRASVIMWSAANEPRTQNEGAGDYFRQVLATIKALDTTRPTTITEWQEDVSVIESSNYVDIVSFNKYNGWYIEPGNLDIVVPYVTAEAQRWHDKFDKPVIHQEYGADTMEGLHIAPDFVWTEEYQVDLMSEHFKAFDQLRSQDQAFFIGEFIWNFADFKTGQTYTRVGGNKKGIFTRNRQPKASAHHLRRRYWALAQQLSQNVTLPDDLYSYVARDEL